jgi:hypothetical protein
MTTRSPTLLRWSEEAEAEQVRTLAMLEGEPQPATALRVAIAARACSPRHRLAMLLRWLGGSDPQKERDGGWPDGLF